MLKECVGNFSFFNFCIGENTKLRVFRYSISELVRLLFSISAVSGEDHSLILSESNKVIICFLIGLTII